MRERDLYRFVSNLFKRSPSPEALTEARHRVIDSLACFYGSYDLPSVQRLNKGLSDGSQGPCSYWGRRQALPAERAVLLNGAGVRALDFNDTYLSKEPCHPSDTLAALWAAAEVSGTPGQGKRVLMGMVRAYELMVRLCDAASLRSRGWDHVTYLPIASAVGASSVLGLTVQQTMQAVALALTGSVAMRQTRVGTISDWKAACAANASRAGLVGALLARAGFTGPYEIFSGKHGFEKQVSGALKFNVSKIGDEWGIFRTHTKYFPAEHHSQSAIEAALAIRRLSFDDYGSRSPSATYPNRLRRTDAWLKNIRRIEVEAFEAAVSIIGSEKEKWRPATRETADHSLPYLVAIALIEGDVTLEQYERGRYLDKDVQGIMDKIKIGRRASYDRMYPKKMPTRLTVEFNGGTTISEEVLIPKGYAGRPFTVEDLSRKFTAMVGRVTSPRKVEWLWTRLSKFERIDKLSSLRAPMEVD